MTRIKNWQYRDHLEIDSPISERRRYNVGDIYINSVICNECDDVITSNNRHDFVTCGCGNVSVDGGSWYQKRSFKEPGTYTENSQMFNKV